MYSNAQILSAVLATFLKPMASQISAVYMKNVPFLTMIENKVKSMGIASPNWSVAAELAPFTESVASNMIEPFLTKYISNIPDEAIPATAHAIVDKAAEDGELKILDGYITLDSDDIKRLKDLLVWNLPIKEESVYKVKTSA